MLFYLSSYQMVFLADGKLNKDPKYNDLKYFTSSLCSVFSIESLRQLKHIYIYVSIINNPASLSVHQLLPT